MNRSVVAIVSGFILTFAGVNAGVGLLRRVMPAKLPLPPSRTVAVDALFATFGIVGVCAIAGCFLAARLASRDGLRHALLLGAIAFALSVPVTIRQWDYAPAWYNLLSLAAVMPFAWLGGKLGETGAGASR